MPLGMIMHITRSFDRHLFNVIFIVSCLEQIQYIVVGVIFMTSPSLSVDKSCWLIVSIKGDDVWAMSWEAFPPPSFYLQV